MSLGITRPGTPDCIAVPISPKGAISFLMLDLCVIQCREPCRMRHATGNLFHNGRSFTSLLLGGNIRTFC
uniref:Uncharacterized protein n=1 Tax=Picea glauca TaxID=3330 RepID=A0A124GNI3_PICGL|nr:hypothetical protein ABT39_MTgene4257 [Picea glauca]QHR90525.1 hypothetical protein Q903MT_gene4550 [Picea sitchensis]